MQKIKKKVKKTGELLCDAGLLTEEQLLQALQRQKETNKKFGDVVIDMGFVSDLDIAKVLSDQLGIPLIDFSSVAVEPEAVQIIPEKVCKKHTVLPISLEKDSLKVVFADPLDLKAIDDIRFATGRQVEPAISTSKQINEAIARYYHLSSPLQKLVDNMNLQGSVEFVYGHRENETESSELIKKSESPPVVKMVNGIILTAYEKKASDIHIEPQQKCVRLRERVDGLMRDVMELPRWAQGLVISRIKIMAKMDISEKRVPQDGKIRIRAKGIELDLRVSTLPTQYGENIVIRILDTQSGLFTLDQIGFSEDDLERVKSLLEKPQGIILISGPTGSGKTSTQYAMINHVKSETIHIITIEDPIEYELPGVSQVQINEKVGLTFAFSLRAILRQDPDVILVGEIRDGDTAFIAMQASITGHLVLSSVHTRSAVGTITRLKNMGILPYLISSSLDGVIAQRLVRLICSHCKVPYKPGVEELAKIGISKIEDTREIKFYKGTGCEKCGSTGYKGRTGIYEVLVLNEQIRELIASEASEDVITKAALSSGMKTVWSEGFKKIMEGLTTIEELSRVIAFKEEEGMMFCTSCNASIRSDFVSCPYCGQPINNVCNACGKVREAEWKYCPYCRIELNTLNVAIS